MQTRILNRIFLILLLSTVLLSSSFSQIIVKTTATQGTLPSYCGFENGAFPSCGYTTGTTSPYYCGGGISNVNLFTTASVTNSYAHTGRYSALNVALTAGLSGTNAYGSLFNQSFITAFDATNHNFTAWYYPILLDTDSSTSNQYFTSESNCEQTNSQGWYLQLVWCYSCSGFVSTPTWAWVINGQTTTIGCIIGNEVSPAWEEIEVNETSTGVHWSVGASGVNTCTISGYVDKNDWQLAFYEVGTTAASSNAATIQLAIDDVCIDEVPCPPIVTNTITFAQTGIPALTFPPNILIINGTSYTSNRLPISFTYGTNNYSDSLTYGYLSNAGNYPFVSLSGCGLSAKDGRMANVGSFGTCTVTAVYGAATTSTTQNNILPASLNQVVAYMKWLLPSLIIIFVILFFGIKADLSPLMVLVLEALAMGIVGIAGFFWTGAFTPLWISIVSILFMVVLIVAGGLGGGTRN